MKIEDGVVEYAGELVQRVYEHMVNMAEITQPEGVSEEQWAVLCIGALAGITAAIRTRYTGTEAELFQVAHRQAYNETMQLGALADAHEAKAKAKN